MLIVQERENIKKLGSLGKTYWRDAYYSVTEENAKNYIKERILKQGKKADDFRIIKDYVLCKTVIEFINPNKEAEEEPEEKVETEPAEPIPKNEVGVSPEQREHKTIPTSFMPGPEKKVKEKIKDKEKTKTLEMDAELKKKIEKIKRNRVPQYYSEDELKLIYLELSCNLGRWAMPKDFEEADRSVYPHWNTIYYHLGSYRNVIDLVIFNLKKDPLPEEYRKIIDKNFGKQATGMYVIERLTDGRLAFEKKDR